MIVKIVYSNKEDEMVIEETMKIYEIDYNCDNISFHWKNNTRIESTSGIQSMEITSD